MNKIYKVIWSKARNCYVVVSELAKRNGKCKAAKTDNVNEGNLLNGMSGATSLHKAAVALLLAGMVAMPGVSEAGIQIGYDKNNNEIFSIYNLEIQKELLQKYKEGVYIIHKYIQSEQPSWDVKMEYENWETFLPFTE